jgi:hypothetical protein
MKISPKSRACNQYMRCVSLAPFYGSDPKGHWKFAVPVLIIVEEFAKCD